MAGSLTLQRMQKRHGCHAYSLSMLPALLSSPMLHVRCTDLCSALQQASAAFPSSFRPCTCCLSFSGPAQAHERCCQGRTTPCAVGLTS